MGSLKSGNNNSLRAKLDAALASIDKGKLDTACNQIGAYENEASALGVDDELAGSIDRFKASICCE